MNIYVGQLDYSVTEDDLKDAFSEFGDVSSVNIITDRSSGQSKGFGFFKEDFKFNFAVAQYIWIRRTARRKFV